MWVLEAVPVARRLVLGQEPLLDCELGESPVPIVRHGGSLEGRSKRVKMRRVSNPRSITRLTERASERAAFEERLSSGERARFAAYEAEKRRADWLLGRIAAKSAVRDLLASEGLPVPDWRGVEIEMADTGAPRVVLPGHPDLAVSLTHGHGQAAAWALRAGPRGGLPGVDLELVRPRKLGALRFYLHPSERAWVIALPGSDPDPDPAGPPRPRDVAAVLLWALKEAAFKAIMPPRGTGLLDVEVELSDPYDAEEGAAVVRYRGKALSRAKLLGVSGLRSGWTREGELVLAWAEASGASLPTG